jgi:hypothetical protein
MISALSSSRRPARSPEVVSAGDLGDRGVNMAWPVAGGHLSAFDEQAGRWIEKCSWFQQNLVR